MPIYAYKCESCGFAKDVLQKVSDPVLTDCPSCGAASFRKQLTAAGFQLKGSGWYVTDFRDGGASTKKAEVSTDAAAPAAAASDAPAATAPAAAHSQPATAAAAPTAPTAAANA